MAVIDGIAFDSTTGIAIDGATATLWSGSAFVTPPAKNEPLPGSGLAGGPITTGPAYGSDGAYRFEGIPVGDYWISVEVNGEIGWEGASTMSSDHADFAGLTDPGAHPASAISILDAAGDFTADNVESALAELQSDAEADATALADHLADTSDAHDASAISVADSGGYLTATTVEAALAEIAQRGTSFPGSPATNDRFFRTDRGILYYYDGTRWLSVTLYSQPLSVGDAVLPITANGTPLRMATMGSFYDWYLVDLFTTLRPITTNDGSNFWTAALRKFQINTTNTTIVTVSTAAYTASDWTSARTAINALMNNGTTHNMLDLNCNKTGAPGNLYAMASITYRLVG